MKNDQTLPLPQETTLSTHYDDFSLKHLKANVTFIDNLDTGCDSMTDIELTPVPHCESYCELMVAREETNATTRSTVSSKRSTMMFTPNLSEDIVKSTIEEISIGWRKLIVVAKSIHRFRSLKVERINSHSGLVSSIVNAPNSKTTFPSTHEFMIITLEQMEAHALGVFRDQLSFFKALEVGGKQDLEFIKEMLGSDPKANLYEATNPERLANKPDHRGYSPLYIACKNGNLEVVKLLIQFQANPYQICKITPKESESIIAVAARWSHLELIKYLMGEGFVWDEVELQKAYNATDGLEIKKIIGAQIVPKKRACWDIIFPCLPVFS